MSGIDRADLRYEDFTVSITIGDNMISRVYPTRNEAAQSYHSLVTFIKDTLIRGVG